MTVQQALPRETLLFGDRGSYVIDSVIGRGGFGITYRAYATEDDMPEVVAVKEFFPKEMCSRSADPDSDDLIVNSPEKFDTVTKLRDRFIKESRNIQECDYPGIVKVLDTIECNGTAYMVMELVEGKSVKEMMQDSDLSNGRLPLETAANLITQLAYALDYLHSKNITHLDVKPDNLMISADDNRLVLIDFGLSRRFNSDGTSDSELLTALTKGYAAPEQYYGVTSFSPESDIYSMGATFYKILTGKTPPEPGKLRENPDLLSFPSYIPDNYCNAILSAMVLDNTERIDTAEAFLTIMQTGSLVPDRVSAEPKIKRNRASKFFFNFLLLLLTMASAGLIFSLSMRDWAVADVLFPLSGTDTASALIVSACISLIGLIMSSLVAKKIATFVSVILVATMLINMGTVQ